jgi:hypothetical protein
MHRKCAFPQHGQLRIVHYRHLKCFNEGFATQSINRIGSSACAREMLSPVALRYFPKQVIRRGTSRSSNTVAACERSTRSRPLIRCKRARRYNLLQFFNLRIEVAVRNDQRANDGVTPN